ncbi:hypothetical protein [Streptomyces sp. SID3343]|uniref:hypothetical protein n=1 Tax=Streptomyces sp. SID3343 TaxID=2690260 RepID=UPI00136BF871|nr:hypothetical protein [Streptomyces sp. SID3343]MYW00393.1 hypothetical protein [Streptomyces sp. SID3343]MYW04596.1 hypothetical protein [Streptomyces sp. SID3343]
MKSTDKAPAPTPEARAAWLRRVAADPDECAAYMASVQRNLLCVSADMSALAREIRVRLRGDHIEGDRFWDARWRARPVEGAMGDILEHFDALADALEKTARKRRAYAEKMHDIPEKRRARALARERKNNPALRPAPPLANPGNDPRLQSGGNAGYAASPSSLYDLGRESA